MKLLQQKQPNYSGHVITGQLCKECRKHNHIAVKSLMKSRKDCPDVKCPLYKFRG